MSSMLLAQLAESPELLYVFVEILSNEGNELYLKSVSAMNLEGTYTISELRQIMLRAGYILIGDMNADKNRAFNRSLEEKITLSLGGMSPIQYRQSLDLLGA